MTERAPGRPFPRWLLVADMVAALLVVAGLVLHNQPQWMASLGLPAGSDLLLGGVGALGVLACAGQFARVALTTARAKSSR